MSDSCKTQTNTHQGIFRFSLIAAAVYFIVWKHTGDDKKQEETRKKHVRFDCK